MTQMDTPFYALLRAAMCDEPFTAVPDGEAWRQIYAAARRQALVGLLYPVAARHQLPMDVAMQWTAQAETIRGLNELQYAEAARLTRLFAEAGRQTAILKGQANARLYPDPYTRQPGDIDIWVNGGRESVMTLLREMGLLGELGRTPAEGKATAAYHHIHLPANERGIDVEVHFRPSSGNCNPLTNRRLQRWLEQEIGHIYAVTGYNRSDTKKETLFNVPSVRFALVMQLAHIQRHFLASGVGLRQVCDYYWLLRTATAEDRQEVSSLLKRFGLRHTAGALMWVLGEVLKLDTGLMIGKSDPSCGAWMLREIMTGGNFGVYAKRQQDSVLRRVMKDRLRNLQLMRFDFWEVLWMEINYWKTVVVTLPTRIRYRTLSLRDIRR